MAILENYTQVFTGLTPDRPGVKNIIVLLTDGASTIESGGIYAEATTIKDAGTTIFGKLNTIY